MLRGLKSGEFDEVIERFKAGKKITQQVSAATGSNPGHLEKPVVQNPTPALSRPVTRPVASPQAQNGETSRKPSAPQAAEKGPTPAVEVSLDEEILSYLIGDKE